MKKLFIASAIAMMCLSANAFAEDDGYGNDIPAARSEGTVDDGYGNKLPSSNEPEYKSFEEARSSSNNGQRPKLQVGVHMGIGYAGFYDYPTDEDFIDEFGKNEWGGLSFDLGIVLKYRLNPLISFVPEINFGVSYFSEEIKGSEGYDSYWKWYKVNDTRTLVNFNIPLALRLNVPFVYLEAGARLNLNFVTSHDYEYTDENGNALQYYDREEGEYKNVTRKADDEWEVKTFVPSLMAGLGTTFLINGHEVDLGIRAFWDLTAIEEHDKLFYETDDSRYLKAVDVGSKIFSIQFVLNYFF